MSKKLTLTQIKRIMKESNYVWSYAAKAAGMAETTFRRHAKAIGYVIPPGAKATGEKHVNGAAPAVEQLGAVEEHKLKRDNADLRKQVKSLTEELEQSIELGKFATALANRQLNPPRWLTPKTSGSKDRAILTAQASDWHLDEVVKPEEIGYVNAYNREIAELRVRNYFDNIVRLSRDYINGIYVEGLVIQMMGDMFSGNIHEELRESNDDQILSSLWHWAEQISAGITMLAEHFNHIFIPCVVGNHGRLDKKPRAKGRVKDNFEWMLYNLLALHLKDISHVEFAISEGADYMYQTYNTRYLCTHGDQFRGGTGIAGALSPLMLGDARKRKRQSSVGKPYDFMAFGHWHQYMHVKGMLGNGSLIGYSEYANLGNFEFEPPQQGFFVTDPFRGKGISAPIHVLDKKEYWLDKAPLEIQRLAGRKV